VEAAKIQLEVLEPVAWRQAEVVAVVARLVLAVAPLVPGAALTVAAVVRLAQAKP
jgi:hypothetical protein